jgi:hypothetical protein
MDNPREELAALRRMAELEAKVSGQPAPSGIPVGRATPSLPSMFTTAPEPASLAAGTLQLLHQDCHNRILKNLPTTRPDGHQSD